MERLRDQPKSNPQLQGFKIPKKDSLKQNKDNSGCEEKKCKGQIKSSEKARPTSIYRRRPTLTVQVRKLWFREK